MKALGLLAAGILVGFVLGGLEPRRALERQDAEMAAVRAERERDCPPAMGRGIPGFDRILSVDEPADTRSAPTGEVPTAPPAEGGGSTGPTPVAAGDAGIWVEPEPDPAEEPDSFHLAAEAQAVRAAQTRAALIERAALDDEEIAELDRVVARTNDRLLGHAEEISTVMFDREEVPPAEMLGVMNEVTGVLHDGQLELEGLLAGRAGSGEDADLAIWNFIDLLAIEDTLAAGEEGP